jgi:hypothetical protein
MGFGGRAPRCHYPGTALNNAEGTGAGRLLRDDARGHGNAVSWVCVVGVVGLLVGIM